MRDALNADMDLHLDFGSQLAGLSYEEMHARREEEFIDAFRQRSKAANFGYPGGLGIKRFRDYARGYGVELTEQESKALKQLWLHKFDEMPLFFKRIRDILNGNGKWIEREGEDPILRGTIQQLVSGRFRGGCSFTEACNSMFQGLTADAMKAAMFEVSRRCYTVPQSALYGCRIVNMIHDELLVEMPEAQAHEASMELAHVMVEVYRRYTPDVKITAEPTLMRRWAKKAKPKFKLINGSQRLIPWEDAQKEAA
jgi:DNA polymerase I-like protein with 3'-5' exonuclease and polymerase domains